MSQEPLIVPPELADRLQQLAERLSVPAAGLLRQAVEDYLCGQAELDNVAADLDDGLDLNDVRQLLRTPLDSDDAFGMLNDGD